MRISGGQARGIPLRVPHGPTVRPATDGLRQAVFSSLGARVADAHFLDLFAGSGAYGLEALSRGAADGVFVERDGRTAACLRENLAAVGRSLKRDFREIRVIEADVISILVGATLPPGIDLVFADPPYESIDTLSEPLFAGLTAFLAGEADPLVMLEMPGEKKLNPPGWVEFKRLGRDRGRQPSAAFFRPSR